MGRKEQGRVATPSDFWSFTSYDIRRISSKFGNLKMIKMNSFKMTSLWCWKVLFLVLLCCEWRGANSKSYHSKTVHFKITKFEWDHLHIKRIEWQKWAGRTTLPPSFRSTKDCLCCKLSYNNMTFIGHCNLHLSLSSTF